MSRLTRVLAVVLALIVLLPPLLVAIIALWAKQTQMPDESYGAVFTIVGGMAWSTVYCAVGGCEPELLEGMETRIFDETLLRSTPVALDHRRHPNASSTAVITASASAQQPWKCASSSNGQPRSPARAISAGAIVAAPSHGSRRFTYATSLAATRVRGHVVA